MTLKKKQLMGVVIITVLTILSTSLIVQFVLLDQIEDYENEIAGRELQGLYWIINEKIKSEERTAIDWAEWDDTYEFVRDGNEDYIRSALVDDTYYGTETNVMLFLNESGEIVYERAFDLKEKKEIDIPRDLYLNLLNHGILYNDTAEHESSAGLIILDDSIMLVSAFSILTSEGKGPARGILIRASYIDPAELAGELGSNAEYFRIEHFSAGSHDTALTETGSIIYHIENENLPGNWGRIHATTTLNDLYGKPLKIEIGMQRSLYIQGLFALLFIIITIVITGILSAAIYVLVFRSSVIIQLETLGKDAGEIAESGDIGRRVDFRGDPEFMQLSDAINMMLASLDNATNEKLESDRKYDELFSSSLDGIVLTGMDGKIIDANPAFTGMGGFNAEFFEGDSGKISIFTLIDKNCEPRIIQKTTEGWEKEKKSFKLEASLAVRENGHLPVELTLWPLTDENDIIRGIWWLVRDISGKKENEKIRREALSRIEDNLERMAILNDEIRNPLSIIVGLADIKCEEAAAEIIEQVEKIDRIINLLDRGWLRSKKVHEFLKKQYNYDYEDKSRDEAED